jgi:hypothetical protein
MQDILAITIVAAAVATLVRRGWLHFSKQRAGICGACSNCNSTSAPTLVNISTSMSHAKAPRREDISA